MFKLIPQIKANEFIQRLLGSSFTRNGLLVAALFIFTGIAMGLVNPMPDPAPVTTESLVKEIILPGQDKNFSPATSPDQGTNSVTLTADAEQIPETNSPANLNTGWDVIRVASGQTLDSIFRSRGYNVSLLHEIIKLNKETKNLPRLRLGQELLFKDQPDGSFSQLRVELGETRFITVSLDEEGLSVADIYREVDRRQQHATGIIRNSLFVAGKNAGLSDSMVMKLANIFVWDIDFVLDIREGDSFSLIYEKLYRDGEFLRDGDIYAATFVNQGEVFRAIRFASGDGFSYFTPEGRNMKKSFLRAPLNFSYITSSFNPKRYHPVLKRVKAHRGIDYGAPRGTPVYSAGDGKVIRSAYSKYNGHHVFIQHANGIVTKYLHFTKRKVKSGQRVRQGQTIGTVGSTGMVTGPHLHYEFVVNGVHRNPRTVKLPKAEPLPAAELPEFKRIAEPLITQLNQLDQVQLLAQNTGVSNAKAE
ncbi:MAG: peptidoglycan DD-metalloendopeptidase family protein [Xanthomonadales bacterium]|nr:peptidoglycan DD-metalloendopeptidase family protein [Xanthomonadales bacterium]